MKKIWLWFISTLVLILFTSYINYCYYAKNINNFVGSMVDTITEKYPEVDEKEIIDWSYPDTFCGYGMYFRSR